MMKPVIKFSQSCVLSPDDLALVLNWPVMNDHIAARQDKFQTTRIVINGADIMGTGEKRRPLIVQARVYYPGPDGKEISYGVAFMEEASALLVALRVTGRQMTGVTRNLLDDYYVWLIRQPRWGANIQAMLEVPAGIGKDPLQEFVEESGLSEAQEGIPAIDPSKMVYLGGSKGHVMPTDMEHQSFIEIDVTEAQLEYCLHKVNGAVAGNVEEGETTHPSIMRLEEAYRMLRDANGASAPAFHLVARYRDQILARLAS